ncbi:MAG: dienelactone hydrolase family protein [Aquisalinus sp.]|nr:dienelactone hydrolase family protein [Aquisalinus sp.]
MAIVTELVEYSHNGDTLEAFVALDDSKSVAPGVLVCHAWAGRSAHEEDVARRLAELGYVGIAVDVYGKGVHGETTEECNSLMTPFVEDRAMLQDRLKAALTTAQGLDYVQTDNIAVCGYCFGGLCALDMARSGAAVKGAASFHGLFMKPGNTDGQKISAKVIAFHGWDDPMAKPEDVMNFTQEMSAAEADWQLHAYGGTMHAFTNTQANDPDFGTVYSADADQRSWAAFKDFLREVLG